MYNNLLLSAGYAEDPGRADVEADVATRGSRRRRGGSATWAQQRAIYCKYSIQAVVWAGALLC